MKPRPIPPLAAPLDAVIEAVPSKSVTHRALIAAALARGTSRVRGALESADTSATCSGLAALGLKVTRERDAWLVEGGGGDVAGGGCLRLGQSGTSLRFLLAVSCLGRRPSRIEGEGRLPRRPLVELIDALAALGGHIRRLSATENLPLEAGGSSLRGGALSLSGARSSQFASALLLVGACLPDGLELEIRPPAVSLPYVELTSRVLAAFEVRVHRPSSRSWRVAPQIGTAAEYRIEGDHSSASYFLAAPAILRGRLRVRGLDPHSAQPDARLARDLELAGCRVAHGNDWVEVEAGDATGGFDLDLSDAPDLVPTLAVAALFAKGPSRFRGVAHLRFKESDRIRLVTRNLEGLGASVGYTDGVLEIRPPDRPRATATIVTAGDHRVAMAFALAGLAVPGVVIDDPACVDKSNPAFWRQLEALAD